MEMFDPTENVITFTDKAQSHFKTVVSDNEAIGIRLRLEGGGCAGFAYKWDLISDIGEINLADYTLRFTDWQFWMDDVSKKYLMGSVVDKKVDIAGEIIDISSPLAASSCGCGESVSFSV